MSIHITVESSLHITRQVVSGSFNPEDQIGDVLDNYLSAVQAPGVGRVKYVLKDEGGIAMKNQQSIKRALNNPDPNRKHKLYLSLVSSDNLTPFSYSNWWIIVGICFLFALMTSGLALGFYLTNKPVPNMYGIVFDAGSVHTTMNVYNWSALKTNGTGIVHEQYFCESSARVGISSFKDDPSKVRDYILKSRCMNESLSAINQETDNVVVFLGGTAGMRILNTTDPVASAEIMGNISVALKSKFEKSSTRIVAGIEEGIYGWITVNYLSNVFGTDTNKSRVANDNTIGALDWGGASSQITFETNNQSLHSDHRHKTTLYGKNYTLYVRSHLCYGQAEATRRYFVNLIYDHYLSTGEISYEIQAPCHHLSPTPYIQTAANLFYGPCSNITSDLEFHRMIDGLSPNETFAFTGTSNFEECKRLVKDAFNPELCLERFGKHCLDSTQIPKPNPDGYYLAFSTYYYLLQALHLPTDVTVQEFSQTVEAVCKSDYATLNVTALSDDAKRNSCFNSCFMYKLLTRGYHFKNWTNIDFVRRVGDAEVGWTLGYMVQTTNDYPSLGAVVNVTLPVFVLLMICGVCFFVLGIFFSYHAWHIERPSTKYQRLGFK